MQCRSCGAQVDAHQSFCPTCGVAVAAPGFDPPQPAAPPPADPTQQWPAQYPPNEYPPTQVQPPAGGYQPPTYQPPGYQAPGYQPTQQQPTYPPTQQQPAYQPPGYQSGYQQPDYQQPGYQQPAAAPAGGVSLKATPLTVAALIAAVAALLTAAFTIVELKADGGKMTAKLGDLGKNSLLVAIITAIVLLGAAILGAGSRRFATGLAGGAGLAMGGWAALHVGLAAAQMDTWERLAIDGSSGDRITITKTFGPGFFTLAIAAVAGLIVFVLSLRQAGEDGGPRFTPVAALVGGLGAIAVAVGPLIPQHGAALGDNFSDPSIPPITLILRLVALAALVIGALIGFFNSRRWGLGMAAGTVIAALMQWITTLGGNQKNVGIGLANIGASDTKPHILTTLGIIAWVVGLIIAAVLINQQRSAKP